MAASPTALDSRKPTLSLCMIVKNEEDYLAGCLDSVKSVVDEMIVVDTGSTDSTIAIAESYGARIFHYAWNDDFAEARNHSLDHATGDWVLYLDADERLVEQTVPCLRAAISEPKAMAYSVRIVSSLSETVSAQCHLTRSHRLFRNLPQVRFEGRIHEQIANSVVRLGGTDCPSDATILHLGYAKSDGEMSEKSDRNLALLEAQVAEDPTNAYAHYNLAQMLKQKGRTREALDALHRALDLGWLPTDITASAYVCVAGCHYDLGEFEECLRYCGTSLEVAPEQMLARVMSYLACLALHDWERAIKELKAACAVQDLMDVRHTRGVALDATFDRFELEYGLAVCHARLGQGGEALQCLKKIIASRPRETKGRKVTQTQEKALVLTVQILEGIEASGGNVGGALAQARALMAQIGNERDRELPEEGSTPP